MSPPAIPHLSGNTPAEKSKFIQTCHRLSLLLKEIGSHRDLNAGINEKAQFDATGVSVTETATATETENSPAKTTTTATATATAMTVDLLSNIDVEFEKSPEEEKSPEYFILDSSREFGNSTNKGANSNTEVTTTKPKPAQMTIFYGGQVMILDDVPAGRARDLILMAKNVVKEMESDLPIARRASLHKFLAKRKDRAAVRVPYYQVDDRSPAAVNGHGFDLNM